MVEKICPARHKKRRALSLNALVGESLNKYNHIYGKIKNNI